MIYGSKTNAYQYDGDCIIEFNEVTYVGRLMPGYQRGNGAVPVEQQPIWQIEKIDTETQTVIIQENSESREIEKYITRRRYPNGNEDYKFIMAEALNYNYEYRH